jgi:hypothetical protein
VAQRFSAAITSLFSTPALASEVGQTPRKEFFSSLLEANTGDIQDTIWDIREACRHIDYHLKDAKLPPGT